MSWEERFPMEFDDADVTLNRPMGGIEIVIDHDAFETPLVAYVEQPDGIDEQLLTDGLIEP